MSEHANVYIRVESVVSMVKKLARVLGELDRDGIDSAGCHTVGGPTPTFRTRDAGVEDLADPEQGTS